MASETVTLSANVWTEVSDVSAAPVVVVPNTPGEYAWSLDSTTPTISGNKFLSGDTVNFVSTLGKKLYIKSFGFNADITVTDAV